MANNQTIHDPQGKIALLVIDVQQGLFERPTPLYQAEQLINNINMLINKARQANAEVLYVQHVNKSILAKGTAAWQLHDAIRPLPTETIIHKCYGSAFEETVLHGKLMVRGVRQIVVTGLTTHGCIKATCQNALDLGYTVILIEDGHSSYAKEAAALVKKWNEKLSEQGVVLQKAAQMDFCNN